MKVDKHIWFVEEVVDAFEVLAGGESLFCSSALKYFGSVGYFLMVARLINVVDDCFSGGEELIYFLSDFFAPI